MIQGKFLLLAFCLFAIILNVSSAPLEEEVRQQQILQQQLASQIQFQPLVTPVGLPIVYRQNGDGIINNLGQGIGGVFAPVFGTSVGSLLGPIIGAMGAFSQGFGNGIVNPLSTSSSGTAQNTPNKVDVVDNQPPNIEDPDDITNKMSAYLVNFPGFGNYVILGSAPLKKSVGKPLANEGKLTPQIAAAIGNVDLHLDAPIANGPVKSLPKENIEKEPFESAEDNETNEFRMLI